MDQEKDKDKDSKQDVAKEKYSPPPRMAIGEYLPPPKAREPALEVGGQAEEEGVIPPLPAIEGAAPKDEPAPEFAGTSRQIEEASDAMAGLNRKDELEKIDTIISVLNSETQRTDARAGYARARANSYLEERNKFIRSATAGNAPVSKAEKIALMASGGISGLLFGTYGKIKKNKEQEEYAGSLFDSIVAKQLATEETLRIAQIESMMGTDAGASMSQTQRTAVRDTYSKVSSFILAGGGIEDVSPIFKNAGAGEYLDAEKSVFENVENLRQLAEKEPNKYVPILKMLGQALDSKTTQITEEFDDFQAELGESIGSIIENLGDNVSLDSVAKELSNQGYAVDNRKHKAFLEKTYYKQAIKFENKKTGELFSYELENFKAAGAAGEVRPAFTEGRTKHQKDLLTRAYETARKPHQKASDEEKDKHQVASSLAKLVNHAASGGRRKLQKPKNISSENWAEALRSFATKQSEMNWEAMINSRQGAVLADNNLATAKGKRAAYDEKLTNPYRRGTIKHKLWETGREEELTANAGKENAQEGVMEAYRAPLESLYAEVYGADAESAQASVRDMLMDETVARSELSRLRKLRAAHAGYRAIISTLGENKEATLLANGLNEIPEGDLSEVQGGYAFTEPAAVEAMTQLLRGEISKDTKQEILAAYENEQYGEFFKLTNVNDPTTGAFLSRTWGYTENAVNLTEDQKDNIAIIANKMLEKEASLGKQYRMLSSESRIPILRKQLEDLLKVREPTREQQLQIDGLRRQLSILGVRAEDIKPENSMVATELNNQTFLRLPDSGDEEGFLYEEGKNVYQVGDKQYFIEKVGGTYRYKLLKGN